MRRSLIIAGAVAATVAVPSVAGAHVTVSPGTVAPGGFEVFTLSVPTEGNSPTTRVELNIPFGLGFSSYEPVRGWRITPMKTRSGRVYKLVLRGRLGVGRFQRFFFSAATPDEPTTLYWGAVQTYANGEVVRWTSGDPDAEHPASSTRVEGSAEGHH